MSHPVAAGNPVVRSVAVPGRAAALDQRRRLQLALGVIWLLDAMLQFQPFMSHGFSQMLAGPRPGTRLLPGARSPGQPPL